jgi:hypothetical protein
MFNDILFDSILMLVFKALKLRTPDPHQTMVT